MVWLLGGATGIVMETRVLGGRRRSRARHERNPIWSQSKARALSKGPVEESKDGAIIRGMDDHFSFC